MDKITRLQKEKADLSRQIAELEKQKNSVEELYKGMNKKIALAYKNWFDEKRNKEFVLYEKYPSMEALNFTRKFPLELFGNLKMVATAFLMWYYLYGQT